MFVRLLLPDKLPWFISGVPGLKGDFTKIDLTNLLSCIDSSIGACVYLDIYDDIVGGGDGGAVG